MMTKQPWTYHFTTTPPAPLSNYAALTLPSGRVLDIHGLGVLAALIQWPSNATEPSFILRNPDGSIEDSGSLNVGEQ